MHVALGAEQLVEAALRLGNDGGAASPGLVLGLAELGLGASFGVVEQRRGLGLGCGGDLFGAGLCVRQDGRGLLLRLFLGLRDAFGLGSREGFGRVAGALGGRSVVRGRGEMVGRVAFGLGAGLDGVGIGLGAGLLGVGLGGGRDGLRRTVDALEDAGHLVTEAGEGRRGFGLALCVGHLGQEPLDLVRRVALAGRAELALLDVVGGQGHARQLSRYVRTNTTFTHGG